MIGNERVLHVKSLPCWLPFSDRKPTSPFYIQSMVRISWMSGEQGDVGVQPRCWWWVEGCVALTAPCLSPSVPWRVIKIDDTDAVPSGSTVSTAQPFAPSFIPLPPPRSNSALITASSIHQCIDGHDRRCGTH